MNKDQDPARLPQQEFLREAMSEMGLTRDLFAEALGVKRRALDNWLLPAGSSGFRPMPEMARRLVACLKAGKL